MVTTEDDDLVLSHICSGRVGFGLKRGRIGKGSYCLLFGKISVAWIPPSPRSHRNFGAELTPATPPSEVGATAAERHRSLFPGRAG